MTQTQRQTRKEREGTGKDSVNKVDNERDKEADRTIQTDKPRQTDTIVTTHENTGTKGIVSRRERLNGSEVE